MAYFAKLGVGNVVKSVVVVNDDTATSESVGADFLNTLYKTNDVWKQTSYNKNIRKNYAGIDYSYDEARDAFIPPKPYTSWTLNESTCLWDPPVTYPDDGKRYNWNEGTQSWDAPE